MLLGRFFSHLVCFILCCFRLTQKHARNFSCGSRSQAFLVQFGKLNATFVFGVHVLNGKNIKMNSVTNKLRKLAASVSPLFL